MSLIVGWIEDALEPIPKLKIYFSKIIDFQVTLRFKILIIYLI